MGSEIKIYGPMSKGRMLGIYWENRVLEHPRCIRLTGCVQKRVPIVRYFDFITSRLKLISANFFFLSANLIITDFNICHIFFQRMTTLTGCLCGSLTVSIKLINIFKEGICALSKDE